MFWFQLQQRAVFLLFKNDVPKIVIPAQAIILKNKTAVQNRYSSFQETLSPSQSSKTCFWAFLYISLHFVECSRSNI